MSKPACLCPHCGHKLPPAHQLIEAARPTRGLVPGEEVCWYSPPQASYGGRLKVGILMGPSYLPGSVYVKVRPKYGTESERQIVDERRLLRVVRERQGRLAL